MNVAIQICAVIDCTGGDPNQEERSFKKDHVIERNQECANGVLAKASYREDT